MAQEFFTKSMRGVFKNICLMHSWIHVKVFFQCNDLKYDVIVLRCCHGLVLQQEVTRSMGFIFEPSSIKFLFQKFFRRVSSFKFERSEVGPFFSI